ncbi:uncharacterized protein LOC108912130 [Anoplophora glabripennis]|uniref:uncharacterized protein LOC108912130 n=1 Tax=Anoplophora glabripennis TaxID=217634 RepID=UPI000874E196|nr:uncharacterized protein LOC108912130 [Anoplophora glabripennis]
MDENYIRRERRRKEETKKTVAEMRAALKVCNMDDVRRHKMPFEKALIIGLEEKGYYVAAAIIQDLIDVQTSRRETSGPSSVLWSKPQLKDNKNLLKTLSDNLVISDIQRNMNDHAKECETFLKTATHFAFLHPDWWWMGEQLLLMSISFGKRYPSTEGKYEALSSYVYAKFLLENTKETESAHLYLIKVRELSKGKKWVTIALFPDERDYLYTRANYLLHMCLMQEARSYLRSDVNKAIKLANIARKRAAEACNLDGETRALLLKGICEVSTKRAMAAIATFTKAYYIQERLGNLEGICMAKLHLAQAYLVNGDTLQSLRTLLTARDCAERNNLTYLLGQAYKHLGEFYLNNGEPRKATPLLGEALKILHKAESVLDIEQVRNLEAISMGLELFPRYLKLLSDTSDPVNGFENLMKMIDWKDLRVQFWSQDDISFDPSSLDSPKNSDTQQTSISSSYDVGSRMNSNPKDEQILKLHDNIHAFQNGSNYEEKLLANEKESVTVDEKKTKSI